MVTSMIGYRHSCSGLVSRFKPIVVDGGFLVLTCPRCKYFHTRNLPFELVVGHDWIGLLTTYTLILVLTTVFLVVFGPLMPRYVPVSAGCLLSINIISLTLTACGDPGIVRRDVEDPRPGLHEEENEEENEPLVDCHACNIKRPRNARHCYKCRVCVLDLDHHCPWIGKCIGKRTSISFRVFIFSLFILAYFMIGCIFFYSVGLAKEGTVWQELPLAFAERLPWPVQKPVKWLISFFVRF
mmetsp:Transcript_47502/g.88493  ORF Transcript_47502/g.88493 Transcript_47502/m.88493 type:complete len:240 (+) Transcript_47502:237-956(+)